jgi:sugar/nucleoside kinase (ribokinase family)
MAEKQGEERRGRVCVIGASNMDLISYVPRMPHRGETLKGSAFQMGFGGITEFTNLIFRIISPLFLINFYLDLL